MSSTQVSKPTGPLEIVEKDIPELGARQGYGTRKSPMSKKSKAVAARAEVTLAITFIVSAFIVSVLPSSLSVINFMSSHCYTMAEALRIDPTVAMTQNSTS
jgi:hypothetical protein